jgi:hypothetical protein
MALRKAFHCSSLELRALFPMPLPARARLPCYKNLCPVTAFVTLPGYVVAQGCEDSTLGVMPDVVGCLRDMKIYVVD